MTTQDSNRISNEPKDDLGCVGSKLRKDVQIACADLALYRKSMAEPDLHRVATAATERGFLIGVSLADGHRRKIFRGARTWDRRFEADSIYVRDFSESYIADMYGNFDFVLVELSNAFLTRLEDEHNVPAIRGLTCAPEQKDIVLGHLSRALAAGVEVTGPLNELFVEQLAVTIGMHVARQYGNFRSKEERAKGTLSPAAEARAKSLLLDSTRSHFSIADIARECNLSRGYFIRAFSMSTGRTPHQWLLEQRAEHARRLVEVTDLTLPEIAAQCGFADQSHMSRVFAKLVGGTPGALRRSRSVRG